MRDYDKIVFLIKSNGQENISHDGKELSFPRLNATLVSIS